MSTLSEQDLGLSTSSRIALFGGRLVVIVLSLGAVITSLISGLGFSRGDKRLVVLSLAVYAVLALATLGATRFDLFVLLLLTIRSSIDVLHLSQPGAGNTTGNTVSNHGIDPSSMIGALFLVTALLWLAPRYASGAATHLSVLSRWLMAFCVAGGVSVVTSQNVQASALQELRITTGIVMFLVLEQIIRNDHSLQQVLIACFVSLAIPLLYTLYGIATGHASAEVKSGFTRLIGTFSQSNDYGRYLGFMIILGVAILPYVGRRAKYSLTISLAISAIFLVLSLTLGALIGTALGVTIVAIVQRQKKLLVALVIAAVLALSSAPGLAGRLVATNTGSSIGGAPTGNSLEWRLNYWSEIIVLANVNPVTGIGLSSTQYQTSNAKQPHNDYLRAYVETGVLGLIAYLGLVIALVATSWRAVRVTIFGSVHRAVATGAFASLIAFAVESGADNVITNVVNFWYLMAFAASSSYLRRLHDKAVVTHHVDSYQESRNPVAEEHQ